MDKELLKKFEEYLNEKYISKNTIQSYLSDINQFLKYFRENLENDFEKAFTSFTRNNINNYKEYLLEDLGYKFTTINRKLASISIYENFLLEENLKETKCIREKDFYKIDLANITSDMLPSKTIKKIIQKSGLDNARDYLIFVLMNNGGLRVSEVINIEVKRDLDFEMRRIIILGKGSKIRYILMNETIYNALEEYLPEREKMLNGKENKYLIISNKTVNTGKAVHRTMVNKLIQNYCEQLNENKINPHIFRHNFATDKYQYGYTKIMLQKVLGQSSNVVDRYAHAGDEENIAKRIRERHGKSN